MISESTVWFLVAGAATVIGLIFHFIEKSKQRKRMRGIDDSNPKQKKTNEDLLDQ